MKILVRAGNIGDVLYGASLIPNLKVLSLRNQSFNGMLPANLFAMPVLEEMDLSNNHIKARPRSLQDLQFIACRFEVSWKEFKWMSSQRCAPASPGPSRSMPPFSNFSLALCISRK